jgi:hypothetical protein
MAGKPADPGQLITWTRHHDGHYEPNPVAAIYGQRWIPGRTETMTGVIWSAGPVASSVWAQLPDGTMQPLKIPPAGRGGESMEMHGYPPSSTGSSPGWEVSVRNPARLTAARTGTRSSDSRSAAPK